MAKTPRTPHDRLIPAVTPPKTRRRIDRNHWLYIAVIIAVVAGIIVGLVAPAFAATLEPVGKAFVGLIKMMIAPIIFCTIVIGIGSIAKAATVGKVGGLALGYFIVMSTFALAIGLVVGNILHPGEGLDISSATYDTSDLKARAPPTSSSGSSPSRCSPRWWTAASCRPSSSRCSSASRCRRWAPRASRSSG